MNAIPSQSLYLTSPPKNNFSSRNFEVHSDPPIPFVARTSSDNTKRNSQLNCHLHLGKFSERTYRLKREATPSSDHPSATAFPRRQQQKAIEIFTRYSEKIQTILSSSVFTPQQRAKLEPLIERSREILFHATQELKNVSSLQTEKLIQLGQDITLHLTPAWKTILSPFGYAFGEQAQTFLLKLGERVDNELNAIGLTQPLPDADKWKFIQRIQTCIDEIKLSKHLDTDPLPQNSVAQLRTAFDQRKNLFVNAAEQIRRARSCLEAYNVLHTLRDSISQGSSGLQHLLRSPQSDLLDNWINGFSAEILVLLQTISPRHSEARIK